MQMRPKFAPPLAGSALPALGLLSVIAVSVAVYGRFLRTGFAATDSLPLIEHSRLAGLDSLGRLFTSPVMGGSSFVLGEVVYRPFVSLTFGVDYLLWGLDSAGYHLSNLLLHLATVGAVWLLLRALGLSRWSTTLGAALFALHPVVVATVPVIGRRDSIVPVAAFATAAVLVLRAEEARRGAPRAILLGFGVVWCGIALLSKESAFVASALLPLLLIARAHARGEGRSGVIRAGMFALPCIALAAGVFVWRLVVLGGLGGTTDADLGFIDFYRYGVLIGVYARDLLWAFADLAPATREIWLRLAAVIVVALTVAMVSLPRRQAALAVVGLAWVVAFGVFAAFFKITTIGWLAYFALVGLALLLGAGVEGGVARLRSGLRCFVVQRAPLTTRLATVTAAGLLLGLLAFSVSAISASALFRDYSQWQSAGDAQARYMQALGACVATAPSTLNMVTLRQVPTEFDDGRSETNMLGVTLIEEYTAQAALRLAYPDRPLQVHLESTGTLRPGATLGFACRALPDGVEFTALY